MLVTLFGWTCNVATNINLIFFTFANCIKQDRRLVAFKCIQGPTEMVKDFILQKT